MPRGALWSVLLWALAGAEDTDWEAQIDQAGVMTVALIVGGTCVAALLCIWCLKRTRADAPVGRGHVL